MATVSTRFRNAETESIKEIFNEGENWYCYLRESAFLLRDIRKRSVSAKTPKKTSGL